MSRHLALVGCTATGKSACALAVARACGDAEVISLDSMQVYRGMDIGTAKPTGDERAAVPHHLVDVADPSEEWSVRATQRAASAALADIETRGRRAIFVGGTGLYVRAVIDALDVPPRDLAIRGALEAETANPAGLAQAFQRLRTVDPLAASRIEPDNQRRIVRALEVIEVTGEQFSSFGPGLEMYGPPAIDVALVGLELPAPDLGERISQRIAAMRAAGLEDEVRALSRQPLSRTAEQAIGYKELLAATRGDTTVEDAFELTERRTRQFARRQRVWFARDPRIGWVDARKSGETLDAV
ncbi:MAG TPA: tRNA (adenosine(37)-N6)-dimethylallyltransferase MiaA, partial [Acidimicrobiia bacterium]|nr:tRNA (adenosine(37)-N6)-dimethylallyltransferase MiaA [Acidimicrobiia bacterium]